MEERGWLKAGGRDEVVCLRRMVSADNSVFVSHSRSLRCVCLPGQRDRRRSVYTAARGRLVLSGVRST